MMNLDARIIISAADQASKVFKAIGGNAQGLTRRLDSIGKSMMVTGSVLTATVTAPVVAFAAKSLNAAKAFEGQMAELRKEVTALPVEQFEALSKSLRGIPRQLPVDLADVMASATQAAEFGVAAESLKDFMTTAATMSVAIGQPLQEVTKSLAEVSKGYQLNTQQLDHAANAVQFYADSLNSSEGDVLAFMRDQASLSRTMGVSAEMTAAIGAAFLSQGQSLEKSQTAYSKLMMSMASSKGMKAAAKIAGMTSKQFQKAWGEDAGGALMSVIGHVAELNTVQEQQAALASIAGSKQATALLPLVRAYAQLAAAQEEAARGGIAGALSAKTADQIKTYESQVKMLGGALYDLQIEIGTLILPKLTPALQSLRGVIEDWTAGTDGAARVDLAAKLGLTAAVAGPALIIAGALARSLASIATAIRAVSTAALALGGATLVGFGGLALLAGAVGLAAWNRWPEIADNIDGFTASAGNAASSAYDMARAILQLDAAEAKRAAAGAARESDKASKHAIVSAAEVGSELYGWFGLDGWSADLADMARRWQTKIDLIDSPLRHERMKNRAPAAQSALRLWELGVPAGVGTAVWLNSFFSQGAAPQTVAGGKPDFGGRPGLSPVSPEMSALLKGIKIAPGSLDQALAGKVEAEIKGQADVNVRIQVDGGRITGTSATSSGNVRPRVGVDNTGAPRLGTERF